MDNLTEVLVMTAGIVMFCIGISIMSGQSTQVRNLATASVYNIENHETVNMSREIPQLELQLQY